MATGTGSEPICAATRSDTDDREEYATYSSRRYEPERQHHITGCRRQYQRHSQHQRHGKRRLELLLLHPRVRGRCIPFVLDPDWSHELLPGEPGRPVCSPGTQPRLRIAIIRCASQCPTWRRQRHITQCRYQAGQCQQQSSGHFGGRRFVYLQQQRQYHLDH